VGRTRQRANRFMLLVGDPIPRGFDEIEGPENEV
jgi:hypothetical protein